MGTLFAIDQAVRGRADRLFLLNPPLKLRITPRLLTTPLLVMSGHYYYSDSDTREIVRLFISSFAGKS